MPAVTEAERLFFEANGYLVVPDALAGGALVAIREAADRAEARWRADESLAGVRRPDLEQVLGIMEYDPVLADLLEHPRLFPMVRELLGPDLMMLDHDYFITPPGCKIPHGWHRDLDFQRVYHPRSRLMVKIFYVLDDVPPDGGATLLLPGSHLFPNDFELPNPRVPEELPGAVQMALPAGSAYLFTGRLYHSAGNNASDRWRRLLIYTYGHKWMRIWQTYEPSERLTAGAETPMRRQLLGLTDPYGPDAEWGNGENAEVEGKEPVVTELGAARRLFFETHGYLEVEGVLDEGELASLRAAADRAEARFRRDPSLPGSRLEEFLELEGILEFDPLFFDLAVHPKLFPLVREVIGTDVSIVDHGYYVTPPGGKLTGGAWHRDVRTPGIYHPRSTVMVRAMWALTDIGPDDGATLILPGSHRWTADVEVPEVATPEEMPGAVPIVCRAGDAYFFSGTALHAPSHNRGDHTRRVVLFNYGHKWMRMWKGHEPSSELADRARTPIRRQLLGLTGGYYGEDAELE